MRWVKPCKCKGSMEFAHEVCLLQYIATKNEQNPSCPHCRVQYVLVYPENKVYYALGTIDRLFSKLVPHFLVMGVSLSAVFLSSIYGVYALLSIGGQEAEQWLANQVWGWQVWVGLPFVPVLLICSRIEAVDSLMPLIPIWLLDIKQLCFSWPPNIVTCAVAIPWIRYFYNVGYKFLEEMIMIPVLMANNISQNDPEVQRELAVRELRSKSTIDLPKFFVGALAMPALASTAGWILGLSRFARNILPSYFLRSITGGFIFIFLKDCAAMYYRYSGVYFRQKKQIVNYME